MSYLRSAFSMIMGGAVLLSSSFCFGNVNHQELSNSSFQNITLSELNVTSTSDIQAVVGPGRQWSQNQLSFTFDASEQSSASGTFKGFVTFPNQVQYSVSGIIGSGGAPVTLQVGPPSLLGNYIVTFVVQPGLQGTINQAQGPYGLIQNLTNGDILNTTFNLNNSNQASVNFTNR